MGEDTVWRRGVSFGLMSREACRFEGGGNSRVLTLMVWLAESCTGNLV